jgi:hypothetical protein
MGKQTLALLATQAVCACAPKSGTAVPDSPMRER